MLRVSFWLFVMLERILAGEMVMFVKIFWWNFTGVGKQKIAVFAKNKHKRY